MTPTTLARKMPIQSKEESISSMQRTALRAAADAERWAVESTSGPGWVVP
jgi:hypothetical protein